jgi:hypothetical protein
LGRLVDDGLLSSVVNGCQRSGGFGREDWDHKGERQKAESRDSRKPGNTESQRPQSREGRKPGKQKVGKAESRETQSHREHREKNRDGGGMLGRWPILQRLAMDGFGCYRMRQVASEEKGGNPSET